MDGVSGELSCSSRSELAVDGRGGTDPRKCDFCGSSDSRCVATRADGARVLECVTCGLAFLERFPSAEQLSTLYGRPYFEKEGDQAGDVGVGYDDYVGTVRCQKMLTHAPILDVIQKYRPLKGARVLEVGCATGEMLLLAQQAGAEVMGVEPSEFAAAIARERYGLPVVTSPFEVAPLPNGTYDIVVSVDVIEHVLSPVGFLRKCSALVREGGLVALVTPNYECARWLGNEWLGFQRSFEHLFFLCPDVLIRMAWACGLTLRTWYTRGSPRFRNAAPIPRVLRDFLTRIPGIRPLYRALARSLWSKSGWQWEEFGHGHSLLMVFERG